MPYFYRPKSTLQCDTLTVDRKKGRCDMFPEELLEKIFVDDEIVKVPIGAQSTILHAMERIIHDNGFEIVKRDMDREVQE